MMTWLVALLAQAALGDPAAPAPVDAPADQAPATETTTATQPPAEAPAAAPAAEAPRQRCYRAQDTGSNRWRRVCVTEAQSQEESDNRLRETVRRSTERGGTSNVLAPNGAQ